MKKKLVELLKKKKITAALTAVVLAAAVGGVAVVQQNQVPELPTYTDPVMEATIEEDETPLASKPEVNTKTSKSTTTKKVKMKKAAAKSYTKALPATSTTSKKTSETSDATIVTQTTVVKNVTEKYTKKSNVKVVTTAATTTVTVTTTAKTGASDGTSAASGGDSVTGTISVSQYAPKADSRVLTAYTTLGFTAEVNSSVSYSGYYDTRNRKITLRKADDTIYHELGHFVAFISGNTDQTAAFKAIYAQEKGLYTAYNKAYVTQSSAEYFAESFKEYTLNPTALKTSRPKTYAAVEEAVSKFTDDRITKVQKVYGVVWK